MALARVFQDEVGVRRLGDRAAMASTRTSGLTAERRAAQASISAGQSGELQRRLRADRAAGGQPEMADDDVGARRRPSPRLRSR